MTPLNATLTWSTSIAASGAAHVGAALLVLAMLDPRPVDDQPAPKSELRIETQQVSQTQATQASPQADAATAAPAKGAQLSEGVVPQSRAKATDPKSERMTATKVTAPTAQPAEIIGQRLATAPAPAAIKPQPPNDEPLPPASTSTQTIAASAPPSQVAAAATATGDRVVAALAFSGDQGQIDPVSLKAISSFMRPGDTAARTDETHDALSAILSSVPCSRLQAEFNPATGSLDLRGHVPDQGLKAPVLAALQAQLGSAIKVNDAMLILPRPQCGALSGIADVGLPQSQDQLTNPRLIGDDAQARAYDYRQGQTLVLDLAAPDYDAYVYVDYFAADGSVIHLVPNDTVPLKLRPAKSALRVGAPDAGEPFLNITIGPPYGQEIAAAFAASSPLYQEERPLSEPAEPYLDWLKAQVAAARAQDPNFKGEWVYFFISTRN